VAQLLVAIPVPGTESYSVADVVTIPYTTGRAARIIHSVSVCITLFINTEVMILYGGDEGDTTRLTCDEFAFPCC